MLRSLAQLLPSPKGLPRAYWFLWSATLVNKLGSFVVPFLAVYLTQERGLGVERAGLVVALYGAGSFASAPVGGYMADRWGRRRAFAIGTMLGAAAMLHLAFARAPLHIAAAALVLGFCGDLFRPSVHAILADVVAPKDRARAFGLLHWAVNLGFAFASTLAGLAIHGGAMLLFLGDAATTLACGALIWLKVPETRPVAPGGDGSAKARGDAPSFTAPYRDGAFVVFVLLSLAIAVVFQQFTVALPLDMRAHGLSPAMYGLLIASNGVLIVLFQPFVLRRTEHFRREHVLAAGSLLTGLGFGATAMASTPLGYALTIAIWTGGEIAMAGAGPAIVAELAPATQRGTYQGAYMLTWSGGGLGAPIVGSFVLAHFGSSTLWSGCLLAGLLVALGFALFSRRAGTRRLAPQPSLPA